MVFQTPKKRELYVNTLPPLGMLGIASFLESKGVPTDVVDCYVQKLNVDYSEYDVICFAVNISNLQNTLDTIKLIKAEYHDKKIVVGGPQTVNKGQFYIRQKEIDAVIIGEGEFTLYEYLTVSDSTKVPGLLIRDVDDKPFFTGERKLTFNLDVFPFPALDKVPLHKYNMPVKQAHPISSIVTSRGCPSKCIFCFHSTIWRQFSSKRIVDEIEWQVKELGVKEICINDDNFTLNRQRAWEICQGIIDRNIDVHIQLKNGIRVDKVDRELLEKMKEAGVWLVAVAPETGSLDTLKKIKKEFTLDRVKEVVGWCKELDLTTYALFMIGFPWETKGHVEQTINFAQELDTDFCQFTRVYPMEGTPLYEMMSLRPINEFGEDGFQHGTTKYSGLKISEEDVSKLIKKAFKSVYLKPIKALRILKNLSLLDIYYLAKYARISSSM